MSDSVRPHRQQPTRLSRPQDSPGKNSGVGCHFLLQCMKVKSEREVAQSCPTLSDPIDCSLPGSSLHGIFQARVLEWGAIAFSDVSCKFSFFFTLNIFFHTFLACRVSTEKPAVSPMGFLCMLFFYFSLAAFNIFSLFLIFVSFMNMCLGLFLFEFIMDCLDFGGYFLSHVREVFDY